MQNLSLVRMCKQQLANLPDHPQLTKLCSNVGITKTVARRQYFTTLDCAELDKLCGSCREYTLPRDSAASKVKGWIRGKKKIGPALGVGGEMSSWPSRNRDHNRILIC